MRWNILKISLLLVVLFYGAPLPAKEQALLGGVSGIYVPSAEGAPPLHWRAEWVWDKGKKTRLALFRKGFVLAKKPKHAILHITASSQYKLYINGEYIRKGPARSAPHHQSFDNFNIAPLLKRGENVIAVEVHFRPEVVSYQFPARAGLIAQLHLPSFRIHSDKSWKVLAAPHWDMRSPKMARFHQQVADRVDMGRFPHGWQSIGFDDGAWEGAVPLLRNAGWPSAQKNARAVSLTPPWTALIPRSYPYLEERDKRAEGLIAGYEIGEYFLPFPRNHARDVLRLRREIAPALGKQLRSYKRGSAPLTLPENSEGKLWLLVFDMGRVVNGMPFFDMEGRGGVKAEIVAMPFMVEDRLSYHMVDSDFLDAVTLSGKRDIWQAQYFKPTRFLAMIVKSGGKPTALRHFGVRELAYPFRLRGGMESRTEGFIADYMAASAATIKAATTDAFTDNYRERRQYAQTGYYAALGNYYLFADSYLQRRYLVQTAQEQKPNGIMPAYAPLMTNDYMVILDSNLLWIRSLKNHLLYSGDYDTVRALLPAAKKMMALIESFTLPHGLINNPPFAYWLDHALNDRRGMNLALNGHYIGALEDYADILDWLGEGGGERYRAQAEKIRGFIRQKFWNEERGLFVDAVIDGGQSERVSEHGNAMALAMKIASERQGERVVETLLMDDEHDYIFRSNGMVMVTPAMSYFLHKGIAEYGDIDGSLGLFRRRFDKMLAPDTNGTLWEEWWRDATGRTGKLLRNGRTRSDAQTESAFPPALFAEYLLGVRPLTPSMADIQIRKMPHSIAHLRGEVPTPFGVLEVEWKGRALSLSVPQGVRVHIEKRGEPVELGAGRHKVRF